MGEKITVDELATFIGVGIHTCLRKYSNSREAIDAWNAIHKMPDDEWFSMVKVVAKGVLSLLGEEEVLEDG